MRHRHEQPPSFDELLARVRDLPEGHRGQIVAGEIHVVEPASPARAHALAEISAALVAGSPLGDPIPDGWAFLTNVEIAVAGEALLVADCAGWRLPKDAPSLAASPVRITPAWVCEVLGGSSRTVSLTSKRRLWAEIGVQHLWIADPEARVLEVFHAHRGDPLTRGPASRDALRGRPAKWLLDDTLSHEAISIPPFEGFRIDVDDLWLPPPAPVSSKRRA